MVLRGVPRGSTGPSHAPRPCTHHLSGKPSPELLLLLLLGAAELVPDHAPAPSSFSQDLGVPDTPAAGPRVSFLSRGWGYNVPVLEGDSRMAWAEAATPPHTTSVLGQGHPRLHLLVSSSSTLGREAGGAAHIASLAAQGLKGLCG